MDDIVIEADVKDVVSDGPGAPEAVPKEDKYDEGPFLWPFILGVAAGTLIVSLLNKK